MASMQNGFSYSKVLLLVAIAAASAFVVTVLILLLCVGCQRKGRSKKAQTDTENHKIMDMSVSRQSKLRSMSKSDTRLHEMNRQACNGASKKRPASMDLLDMPRQHSSSDLHCPLGRLLPQIPPSPGEEREHMYSEVGHRASLARCPDDALYESVGDGAADRPAIPPPASSPLTHGNTHSNRLGKGSRVPIANTMAAPQDPVTAEYACIRKVRKVDCGQRKEDGEEPGQEEQQLYSNTDLHSATPPPCPHHALATPPPHPHGHEAPRKATEAFTVHPFPKEAVFMGNGEQYIWKPPEDDDINMLQHKLPGLPSMPHGKSGQSHPVAVEISEMYSKVCKPAKKKWPLISPPDPNGQGPLRGCEGGAEGVAGCDTEQLQPRVGVGAHPTGDPSYEAIGGEESDPAYETIDANWKRNRPPNAALKPKKRQQQQPVTSLPSEDFYESIGDVRDGAASSGTTTIFTFNDGMEMYVTGL